jgi:hypothetical protein
MAASTERAQIDAVFAPLSKILSAVGLRQLRIMIVKFSGLYGTTIDLDGNGEIQGYEFLEPPIEYRFVRAGSAISEWMSPEPRYISLLHPVCTNDMVRTRGLDTADLAIETRGLAGTFTLLVWPRE